MCPSYVNPLSNPPPPQKKKKRKSDITPSPYIFFTSFKSVPSISIFYVSTSIKSMKYTQFLKKNETYTGRIIRSHMGFLNLLPKCYHNIQKLSQITVTISHNFHKKLSLKKKDKFFLHTIVTNFIYRKQKMLQLL